MITRRRRHPASTTSVYNDSRVYTASVHRTGAHISINTGSKDNPALAPLYENMLPTIEPERLLPTTRLRDLIRQATSVEELIHHARDEGLGRVATRLERLVEAIEDEPESEPIDIESLRSALTFLAGPRLPVPPDIGVRNGGLIDFDWRFHPDGILTVVFNTTGSISFALSAGGATGTERQRANGTINDSKAMRCIIRAYTPKAKEG